jgi:hypothetical protein
VLYYIAIMGFVAFVVIAFLISEWRSYRAGRGLLDKRLIWTRTFAGIAVLALLAMVLWGMLGLPYSDLMEPELRDTARWQIFYYWASVAGVVLILLAFLIVDYKLLKARTDELKNQISSQFVGELQEIADRAREHRQELEEAADKYAEEPPKEESESPDQDDH